jgi:hypothetical protein
MFIFVAIIFHRCLCYCSDLLFVLTENNPGVGIIQLAQSHPHSY